MRRIILALVALLVIGGCGKAYDDSPSAASSSSTTTLQTSPGAAFPEDVPTESDGECSVPRTDPTRPEAGPLGKITDGVTINQVEITDDGVNSVIVDFMVSSPPYVRASSGERWVVVQFDGVRRFEDVFHFASPHARRLPASVCDDSSWAFAFAFDREIESLSLENEAAPRLRVLLKA